MATFGQTFVQVYWPELEGRGVYISGVVSGRAGGQAACWWVSLPIDDFFLIIIIIEFGQVLTDNPVIPSTPIER